MICISKLTKNENGDKVWTNENNLLHREDGPARQWNNGNKEWYYGDLHRENGPAVDHINGNKFWFLNGKEHRLDGPAIEYANGKKGWWYHGKKINCNSQEEFENKIKC